MTLSQTTAGIVIIGDEILSGRVKDQNSPFLIKELADQGVQVRYCLTIPDELPVIAKTVSEYAPSVTWMFTAGGIGPTHDDITMEGIAKAFKTPLVVSSKLEEMIKTAYGDRCKPEHLKMAQIPDGTKLVISKKPRFPIIQFQNIIILPGVPEFLKALFTSIKDKFQGEKRHAKELCILTEEGEITSILNRAIELYPGVKIGSYPCFKDQDCIVKLIVEHQSQAELDKVADFFEKELGEFIRK